MKVALVHDWLVKMAGGEKVLQALYELYDAPIFTLFAHQKTVKQSPFASADVTTSFLQRFPNIHSYYRNLLPLFPRAIESLDLSDYDLILSSSHCVAKGVRKQPHQLHICYCHTPMRYAWDLYNFRLESLSPIKKFLARPILRALRLWDKYTASRVDHFIAVSKHVAKRIEEHYGKKADVIYPPVNTHLFTLTEEREDYYFTCARLERYKRIDVLIDAFAKMPGKRLLIAGEGPERRRLQSKKVPNVHFLGRLSEVHLRETFSKARAFVYAAEEDFGIANVEAQSAGLPVIAYGKGGALETVLPGKTGLFFREQTPKSFIEAIERFEKMEEDFEPEKIRAHAETFSKERFQREIRNKIEQLGSLR